MPENLGAVIVLKADRLGPVLEMQSILKSNKREFVTLPSCCTSLQKIIRKDWKKTVCKQMLFDDIPQAFPH